MVAVLADIPPLGGYHSLVKLIVMLVLVVPWLWASPLVHKDAIRVRAPRGVWSFAVLGAGAAGFLIWLLIPYYVVGLLFYVVLTAATFAVYVSYRNGRVDKSERVFTAEHLRSLLSSGKAKTFEVVTRVKLYDARGRIVMPPNPKEDPAAARGYSLAQNLLYDILWHRASEADLSPAAQEGRLRFVIDGVAVDRPALELAEVEAVIQYLKPIANMNLEERRRPQQGKVSVDQAGKAIDMELVTAGSTGGQRMQFRVIHELVQIRLDGLGISEDILQRIREMNRGSGLIVASARPGNGLTSTLYSLLREHDAFTQQLVTFEAKTKVELENVTQTAYGEPAKLAEAVVSALRREPDVLMVDQCPDARTAQLIREAAGTKLVLLGVQAPDSFTALAKWVKLCADANAALALLRGVVCQVLLRTLCPNCREAYSPDPRMLAKANISAQKVDKFYQPPTTLQADGSGNIIVCAACQGSGYLGRTAVFELLEVTDEIRQLVAAGSTLSQIRAVCRKNKMRYIQEEAVEKVIAGLTSIQEVIRVTQQQDKKG